MAYTFGLNETDAGTCWQVVEMADRKALFNVSAKKYADLKEDGSLQLSDNPVALNIEDGENGITINGISKMLVVNNTMESNAIDLIGTDVKEINSNVYSIDGRIINTSPKMSRGLYIRNGKKYQVK